VGTIQYKDNFYKDLVRKKDFNMDILKDVSAQSALLITRLCISNRFQFSMGCEEDWDNLLDSTKNRMESATLGHKGALLEGVLNCQVEGAIEMDSAIEVAGFKLNEGGLNLVILKNQAKVALMATWSRYWNSPMAAALDHKDEINWKIQNMSHMHQNGIFKIIQNKINKLKYEVCEEAKKRTTGSGRGTLRGGDNVTKDICSIIPMDIEGLLDSNYHFKQLLRVVHDMEKSKWVERANISKKNGKQKIFK
jgi:hypothetical protein